MRLFAVLLTVLALGAQQRVSETVRSVPPTATSVVAERGAGVQSDVVHAAPSVHVAKAPLLARLPIVPAFVTASRLPSVRRLVVGATFAQRGQLVTHFQAKRRIPRMNSEEPPRV